MPYRLVQFAQGLRPDNVLNGGLGDTPAAPRFGMFFEARRREPDAAAARVAARTELQPARGNQGLQVARDGGRLHLHGARQFTRAHRLQAQYIAQK